MNIGYSTTKPFSFKQCFIYSCQSLQNHVVGGFNPSETYESIGMMTFPTCGKIINPVMFQSPPTSYGAGIRNMFHIILVHHRCIFHNNLRSPPEGFNRFNRPTTPGDGVHSKTLGVEGSGAGFAYTVATASRVKCSVL